MGRPTKRSPHLEALILAELAFGYDRERALSDAHIDRATLYRWMARDPRLAIEIAFAEGRGPAGSRDQLSAQLRDALRSFLCPEIGAS